MKINKALWNYYSAGDYQSDIEFFTLKGEDFISKCREVLPIMHEDSVEDQEFSSDLMYIIQDLCATYKEDNIPNISTRDEFYNFINEMKLYRYDGIDPETGMLIRNESNISIKVDDIRTKCSYIPAISIFLYARYGWYVPLFYCERHDLFEKYCHHLDIDIPDRPAENDYAEAIKYYYDICIAVNAEKEKEGLTDEEMAALIYGFATLLGENDEQVKDSIPAPRRVWITCAGIPGKKDQFDFKEVDEYEEGVEHWACNRLTSPGDVVIMYCVSPRSYIHSIWRAIEAPHMSPFSYRKVRAAIGHKIDVPHITLKELRADEYMSNCYVVRKNFMGTHGDELTPQDYENILRMIEERGGDTTGLPRFTHPHEMDGIVITSEQDVSDKLVVPFLKKLGYKDEDYKAELYLQLGHVNREADNHVSKKAGRPDFTIFHAKDSIYEHQYRAPFTIEVKEDFNEEGLEKVKGQGLSYARYLHSRYFALADKYSFMLFERKDDETYGLDNPVFSEQWTTIYSDPDVYASILNKLHPDLVKVLK